MVGGLIHGDLRLCSSRGWQFPHGDVMEIRFMVLCVAKTITTDLLTRRNMTRRRVPVARRCICVYVCVFLRYLVILHVYCIIVTGGVDLVGLNPNP